MKEGYDQKDSNKGTGQNASQNNSRGDCNQGRNVSQLSGRGANPDKGQSGDRSKRRGGSGARLAAVLMLLLLLGAFWFVVTDNPHVSNFRDKMLSQLSSGSEDSGDGTTDQSGEPGAGADNQSGAGSSGQNDNANSNQGGSGSGNGSGGGSGNGSGAGLPGSTDSGSITNVPGLDPNALPEFNGEHYVIVNNNVPAFPDDVYARAGYTSGDNVAVSVSSAGKSGAGLVSEEGKSWTIKKNSVTPYEFYGDLDNLGRCTVAYGCLGEETMPPDDAKRGDISKIHPSGWAKAQNWERSHLIAWKLSDENANACNLITGTHYLNHDGMRPIEEEVEHYIWNTGNHVLYMSRPVFSGNELVARGVQMVARSVEDDGKGISYNVYLFNVTPGAEINYYNGVVTTSEQAAQDAREYVINTRSKVFHYPSCEGAQSISNRNRKDVVATRKELTDQGYMPCGACEP